MKKIYLLITFLLISKNSFSAELDISGFGSLTGGSVVSGDGYIAAYPNLGVYDDGFDIGQETRIGIQTKATFNEHFAATLQVMSRANNDYDLEVEWLYLTYQLSDEVNIQAGKMRMPVYYFSEFMDVGFAYPWLRIPSDTYSLDITNFNGIKFNKNMTLGEVDTLVTLYTGKQDNPNDELMSYLFEGFTTNIDREFKDIIGIVLDSSYGELTARLTYTQADLLESQTLKFSPGIAQIPFDIVFKDIYLQYDFANFSLMAEYNEYEPFYKSYFGSAVYRHNDWQFYLIWSKFDLDLPFEEHDSVGVGFRYDLGDGIAIKVDYTDMTDDGFIPVDGGQNIPNPVYHADDDGNGDVGVLTVSLDFIF